MNTKKEMIKIGMTLWLVLSLSLIFAAVSDPYLSPETPLRLAPGETFIATLNLQNANPSESGDKVFKAEITSDKVEIEVLDKDLEYEVPYGETAVPVEIKITVPENLAIGEIGKVTYSFSEKRY